MTMLEELKPCPFCGCGPSDDPAVEQVQTYQSVCDAHAHVFCERCNKCHSPHRSYADAETCEFRHITDASVADFSEALARIMEPKNVSPKERFK